MPGLHAGFQCALFTVQSQYKKSVTTCPLNLERVVSFVPDPEDLNLNLACLTPMGISIGGEEWMDEKDLGEVF